MNANSNRPNKVDNTKAQVSPANLITSVKEKTCVRGMRNLPTYGYPERLSAGADELRNSAKHKYNAARDEAKLLEDEIKDQVRTLMLEANTEQSKAEEIADQKYNEVLEMAKKSKKPDDTDKNKSKEYEEALSRAKEERQKIYDEILEKCLKKRSLANAKLRKAKVQFNKAIQKAARKLDEAEQEANRIDNYVNY